MRRSKAGIVAALAALVGGTVAAPARADDAAVAQALFDQARKAMAAHQYADACPKLEESYRLDPALGTLLNLAACYEGEGRVATAWSKFLELSAKARAAGQMQRARIGADRAAALAPKLSNLAIDVPPGARVPGLEIRRDGTPVGAAEWGTPLPADPGDHTIAASAPDRKPWSTTVTVAGAGATQRVSVPPLAAAPAVAGQSPTEPGASNAASEPPPAGPERPASGGGNGLRLAGWVTGGAGVAGLAAGGVFGLLASSAWSSSQSECRTAASCPNRAGAQADHDRAVTFGDVSTAAFVAGGALVALGATFLLISPHAPHRDAAWTLAPSVGPAAADVTLSGEF